MSLKVMKSRKPKKVNRKSKSQKPVKKSQKPVKKSRKRVKKSRKPKKTSRKPVKKSRKPKKTSRKPVKKSRKPVKKSRKPVKKSRKPKKTSRKPKKTSRKPKKTSRKPVKKSRKPKKTSRRTYKAHTLKSAPLSKTSVSKKTIPIPMVPGRFKTQEALNNLQITQKNYNRLKRLYSELYLDSNSSPPIPMIPYGGVIGNGEPLKTPKYVNNNLKFSIEKYTPFKQAQLNKEIDRLVFYKEKRSYPSYSLLYDSFTALDNLSELTFQSHQ